MKYYGWRGILLDDNTDSETEQSKSSAATDDDSVVTMDRKNEIRERIQSTCSREEHSVWACRAVATGCGKELGALKACFDKEGPFDVLTAPLAGYELKQQDDQRKVVILPCHDLQAALGNCVNVNGQELYQRRKQKN
jgi:hypothetical protein